MQALHNNFICQSLWLTLNEGLKLCIYLGLKVHPDLVALYCLLFLGHCELGVVFIAVLLDECSEFARAAKVLKLVYHSKQEARLS